MIVRRSRRDDGVALVMMALLIVAILAMVAFAVDLGFGRSDRRTSRALTDLAAVAAGYQMAGNADPNQFNPQADPEAACRAAIESVRDNASDFDPPTTASDACSGFAAACTGTPFTPVEISDGPWTLTISYPVPDSEIMDPNLGADGLTDADGEPCERMRVQLRHSRDTFFAQVIGISTVNTGGTAVVVGNVPDPIDRVVPAFLMLDRTLCEAIWTNVGQGTIDPKDPSLLYGDGILVRSQGSGADEQPGFIHTDSDATDCGNGANEYAVYANEPSGGDTMVVQSAADGRPGVIESTATNGKSGAGGTNVPVGTGEVVGRSPVDEIFQNAIKNLHTVAYSAVNQTAAPSGTVSDPVVIYGCTGTPTTTPPSTGSWTAYVDCVGPPANTAYSKNLQISATTVVFAGNVSVGNNTVIDLPQATTIVVRGELAVGTGGKLDLESVRNFYVGSRFTNAGGAGINASFDTAAASTADNPSCDSDGKGPNSTNTARLVVFNPTSGPNREDPALASSGFLTMCQTTVYLAGERNDATYVEKSIENTASCTQTYPCPLISTNDIRGARFQLSGEINWFAPGQSDVDLSVNEPLPTPAA